MFGERFNKTLNLILENDKSNRDEIVDFINDIPDNLNLLIIDKLSLYEEYLNGKKSLYDSDSVFCLSDSLKIGNEYMYSFVIDMVEDSLTIKKGKINRNGLENEKKIVLYAETTYNSISTLGKQRLGSFKNIGNSVDYNVINTVFGLIFVISNDGILNRFKRFKNDLVDNNRQLVRTRKK